MIKAIKIICGTLIALCGAGLLVFGVNLFTQQQSWLMFSGMLTVGGIGGMLVWLGYSVARGMKVKDILDMLLLIAGGGPR
ncbi:hypothetical protein ACWD0Z_10240 [Streptomyces sp. NPDC003007]